PEWEARVAALGEGMRQPSGADAAQSLAHACEPTAALSIDTEDPLGLHGGQAVTVAPTFSDRGTSYGTLAGLDADQIVIAVTNETVGTVHVHFPRLGYRVERA
ncbi:MAG: glutathione S-transferase family protein, partial [Pseudomonadota bacterium]